MEEEAAETVSGRSFWNLLASDQSGWIDPSRQTGFSALERHIICRRNGEGYPMRLFLPRWSWQVCSCSIRRTIF